MIRERVAQDLKDALKANDARRIGTLRLISAAVKDRDIAAQSDDNPEGMGDEEIQALLARMICQRQEGAKSYEEGGRLDLAAQEIAEIAIIREYLPRQMSETEVKQAVAEAIKETGAASIRDVAKVMACLKSRHTGHMDFGRACAAVKQSFG
jgi:uncharacterized protein YqeY